MSQLSEDIIIKQVPEKLIYGISCRTSNAREMNPETAKIGKLHARFDELAEIDYAGGARVYGAYYAYESDASGEFNVFSGTDQVTSAATGLESLSLPAATYMLFKGKGEMPQVVIELWQRVWSLFADPECAYQRAYTVDYESYLNQNEVVLHIALNTLPESGTQKKISV